jgi:hypothetical protein
MDHGCDLIEITEKIFARKEKMDVNVKDEQSPRLLMKAFAPILDPMRINRREG